MIDWDAVHTAVNICLFPPIFFFSSLYYTDVLSTFIVVKAYEHFLQERGAQPKFTRGILTYLIGVMALLMRQTNIFWVAIFMGGLELARAFHKVLFFVEGGEDYQRKGSYNEFVELCYRGAFHDPKLEQAGATGNFSSFWVKTKLTRLDVLWCALSLGAVTISHPGRVAARLWPYIALLLSFTGFVFWNGGVVLGE
jgi:alpha-1,2-glucosyltransferase